MARRRATDWSFGTSQRSYESERREAHENQGGIEAFIVLLDVVGIVLGCLPHYTRSAASGANDVACRTYHFESIRSVGTRFLSVRPFRRPP